MLSIANHQGKGNQNHNKVLSHMLEWLLSKRQKRTSVGEDVEKREPSCTAGRIYMVQPLCKTVQQFFRKLKFVLAYHPETPLLGIYLMNTETLT